MEDRRRGGFSTGKASMLDRAGRTPPPSAAFALADGASGTGASRAAGARIGSRMELMPESLRPLFGI